MPRYLDTSGRSTLGIGICGRCKIKFPMDELIEDPNTPGLYVCREDADDFDPWRLPARQTEDITLDHPRPDASISGLTPVPQYTNLINGIASWQPTFPWSRSSAYSQGATVTPLSTDNPNTDIQNWFLALNGGNSAAVTPKWPTTPGAEIQDGTITWLCLGVFPATAESSGVLPYNPPKPSAT